MCLVGTSTTGATPRLLNETDLVDKIAELALSLPVARSTTNPDGASLAQVREARDRNKAKALAFVIALRGLVAETKTQWEPKAVRCPTSAIVDYCLPKVRSVALKQKYPAEARHQAAD